MMWRMLIAKALLATPILGPAIRWMAGAPVGEPTREELIYAAAADLRRQGIGHLAALAAAEAVQVAHEHGLIYDGVEYDEPRAQWWLRFEPEKGAHPLLMPLPMATAATQREIGATN